ncbi:coatomer subunit beta'-2-like protein [Tanacetum coccineum]
MTPTSTFTWDDPGGGLLGMIQELDMAEDCLKHANDLSGLLLMYFSFGDAEEIAKLASLAKENGKNNLAFSCLFMLGKLEDYMQLLVNSNQIPEAALTARSYLPSKVSEILALWRKDLKKVNSVTLTVCALGAFVIVSRVYEIKDGCLEAFANKEVELDELRSRRKLMEYVDDTEDCNKQILECFKHNGSQVVTCGSIPFRILISESPELMEYVDDTEDYNKRLLEWLLVILSLYKSRPFFRFRNQWHSFTLCKVQSDFYDIPFIGWDSGGYVGGIGVVLGLVWLGPVGGLSSLMGSGWGGRYIIDFLQLNKHEADGGWCGVALRTGGKWSGPELRRS